FKHEAAEGAKISSLQELPEELKEIIDENNAGETVLIQRNHTIAYSSLSKELEDKGVILTDIFTAIREHSDLVQKYFMTDAVQVDEHRLTALHATILNGGAFVYSPKNVEIKEPLQTNYWQEDPEASLFNHVVVVADTGRSVAYVEHDISNNEKEETIANIVPEVV